MLLERTLMTLQSRAETPERARELGRLGFLQWMMFLRSDANYPHEANRAWAIFINTPRGGQKSAPAAPGGVVYLPAAPRGPLRFLPVGYLPGP